MTKDSRETLGSASSGVPGEAAEKVPQSQDPASSHLFPHPRYLEWGVHQGGAHVCAEGIGGGREGRRGEVVLLLATWTCGGVRLPTLLDLPL